MKKFRINAAVGYIKKVKSHAVTCKALNTDSGLRGYNASLKTLVGFKAAVRFLLGDDHKLFNIVGQSIEELKKTPFENQDS